MRPTFFGLDIARRALQSQMRALDVVGHNIANANTPGYSRQVALLGATPAITPAQQAGQLGTGVQVMAVRRVHDEFIEMQLRAETESYGRWNARYEALQQVELILQEPSDLGLRDALDQFWQSLQDLHQQPESDAARAVVRERALLVAASFQHVHKQLTDLQLDLDRLVGLEVMTINSLTERLADVNRQIHRVSLSGQSPNDLLDERDKLLLELAEHVDIHVMEYENGTVHVSVGGLTVVDRDRSIQLVTQRDPDNNSLLSVHWGPTGQKLDIPNGRLAGVMEARDELVGGYIADLDRLARTIIQRFNEVHQQGFTREEPPALGGEFFTGTGAKDMSVHQDIQDNLAKIAASADGAPGNGANALSLAQVFHTAYTELGNASPADFLRAVVSSIGVTAQQARSMVAGQTALVEHLRNRKESLSGVSLDEEMVDMVRFQQAYAAAARLVTAMDEALEVIINRMGVVGR